MRGRESVHAPHPARFLRDNKGMSRNQNAPVVLISGGDGFIGRSLTTHLVDIGRRVRILTQGESREEGDVRYVHWRRGDSLEEWDDAMQDVETVINLAGRSVDCVKTPETRDEILRSRLRTTEALGAACSKTGTTPKVWIQMSTAHIYGDPPYPTYCDETSPFGYGFAPDVGRAWEEEFHRVVPEGTRGVIFRPGFVLGQDGGALMKMRLLAKLGLGGTIGNGRQGMSWIHQTDMNRLFARAIVDESMTGVYIASSPNPVSNREFMKQLRRAVKMPIGLPAPKWMVRLGAPMLGSDPELAIYGRYVVPRRLLDAGFDFEFPQVGEALRDLC